MKKIFPVTAFFIIAGAVFFAVHAQSNPALPQASSLPSCAAEKPYVLFERGVFSCVTEEMLIFRQEELEIAQCAVTNGGKYFSPMEKDRPTVCAEGDSASKCPPGYTIDKNNCMRDIPDPVLQLTVGPMTTGCRRPDGTLYEVSTNACAAPEDAVIACNPPERFKINLRTNICVVNADQVAAARKIEFTDINSKNPKHAEILEMLKTMVEHSTFEMPYSREFIPDRHTSTLFALQIAIAVGRKDCGRGPGDQLQDICVKKAKEAGLISDYKFDIIKKADFYKLLLKAIQLVNGGHPAEIRRPRNLCRDIKRKDPLYETFALANHYGFLKKYRWKGKNGYCLPNLNLSRQDAASIGLKAKKVTFGATD